jgi:uracil-DNA glycosylase
MIHQHNFFDGIHPEWLDMFKNALNVMDPHYLHQLQSTEDYYPVQKSLFAVFRDPLSSVRYLLLGESPYPRAQSANGYAFWDASVHALWSQTGLSKEVNRATSLRNLIKMLLYARGDLCDDCSQEAISRLDKTNLLQTGSELFRAFIQEGFLLLNASLVYSEGKVPYHARQWRPFMDCLLRQLLDYNPNVILILFGQIAFKVGALYRFSSLVAEHPYNLTFITNPEVVHFFKPLDLLGVKHND